MVIGFGAKLRGGIRTVTGAASPLGVGVPGQAIPPGQCLLSYAAERHGTGGTPPSLKGGGLLSPILAQEPVEPLPDRIDPRLGFLFVPSIIAVLAHSALLFPTGSGGCLRDTLRTLPQSESVSLIKRLTEPCPAGVYPEQTPASDTFAVRIGLTWVFSDSRW